MGSKGRTATQPDPKSDSDSIEELPETGPLRRCLVTRASFARETMLRFAIGPEQIIVFDVAATLPGRGMWLSASGDVVDTAVKRGVFSRAAKAQVKVPQDLRASIEAQLLARVTDLLGLARRAGHAISGFEKAREWLLSGKAGVIVQAADGSVEERARFIGSRPVAVVSPLPAARLGQIFGRDHAVHAAIAHGRLAGMIEIEAIRLAGVAGGKTSGHTAPKNDVMS